MKNRKEFVKWVDERLEKGYSLTYEKLIKGRYQYLVCYATNERFKFEWNDYEISK